jgi:hypothetical protein
LENFLSFKTFSWDLKLEWRGRYCVKNIVFVNNKQS